MKRFSLFLFSICSLLLFAEEETKGYWDYHPIHMGGNSIFIGQADIDQTPEKGHLAFRKSNAFFYWLLPVSRTSFFLPRVEWNTFTMDWNKNPKFRETDFQYIQYALTFYTHALEKWRWILRADYNMNQKHTSLSYGLFSALLWGAHEIHRKWHYHIGALGYIGLEGDVIYPLIGADYAPNKRWLFRAIFPIDYAIEYNLTDRWRLALKGRPLKERFRTGRHEPQPRSVFNYSSIGAEFNAHYEIPFRLEIEFYGGYNFGGSFYIKNKKGHNALYTDVLGAPYGGATLNFGF